MKVDGLKSMLLLGLILFPTHGWAASGPGWWYRTLASSGLTQSVVHGVVMMALIAAVTTLSLGSGNLYPLVRVIAHSVITLSSVTVWSSIVGVGFGALIVVFGYAYAGVPHDLNLGSDKRRPANKPELPIDDEKVSPKPIERRAASTPKED